MQGQLQFTKAMLFIPGPKKPKCMDSYRWPIDQEWQRLAMDGKTTAADGCMAVSWQGMYGVDSLVAAINSCCIEAIKVLGMPSGPCCCNCC
jgi:hypothetical protein